MKCSDKEWQHCQKEKRGCEGCFYNDEISIGEYVRTPEQGFIGKLVEINKDVLNYYKIDVGREIRRTNGMNDNCIYSRDGFGLKHSKNIIDLVQKDDYVNGCKVYRAEKDAITVYQEVEGHPVDYNYIMADEIKTIVTKEQIKQIEFRIKE